MSDKANILVVEDNDFVRMQITRYLGHFEEFEIVDTARGDDALEMCGKNTAAAIVDVRMEPIDGFEFIRSLQGLELKIPVILVTGDQNPDLLGEANKWGVAAVLIKPVQKDRLIKTVERILKIKSAAGG